MRQVSAFSECIRDSEIPCSITAKPERGYLLAQTGVELRKDKAQAQVVSALLDVLLLSCFPCPTAASWNNHFIFYAEEKEIQHCRSVLLLQLQ